MHRLNIVQPSMKSRSSSVMAAGSEQHASYLSVRSFISLEALMFEK